MKKNEIKKVFEDSNSHGWLEGRQNEWDLEEMEMGYEPGWDRPQIRDFQPSDKIRK